MVTLGSAPDLLRLLAVPVFAWTAYRDVETRRVPNRTWLPLVVLGLVALAWEGWLVLAGEVPVDPGLFGLRVAISVGFVVPLAYAFWWIGGFGGADAKALMALAILFPTFPTYFLPTVALPVVEPVLGVFSMTVLSNTVVLGIAYPFVLAVGNGLGGHVGRAMFVGRPVAWDDVPSEYGRLLEAPDGFTRRGLDVDALRMYLRWRGTTLDAIRESPDEHRDPASIPAETNPPGDGSIPATDGGSEAPTAVDDAGREPTADAAASADERDDSALADPWGAERFLNDIEGSAYGTSPEQLRGGLEVLATAETVWITPGIPFLLPMFFGLVVALTYGDLLYAAGRALGLF